MMIINAAPVILKYADTAYWSDIIKNIFSDDDHICYSWEFMMIATTKISD